MLCCEVLATRAKLTWRLEATSNVIAMSPFEPGYWASSGALGGAHFLRRRERCLLRLGLALRGRGFRRVRRWLRRRLVAADNKTREAIHRWIDR